MIIIRIGGDEVRTVHLSSGISFKLGWFNPAENGRWSRFHEEQIMGSAAALMADILARDQHRQRLASVWLNETLFTARTQLRAVLAAWKNDHNNVSHTACWAISPQANVDFAACPPQRARRYAGRSALRPLAHATMGSNAHRESLALTWAQVIAAR